MANRKTSQTVDPTGLKLITSYAYDTNGNLSRVVDPKQQTRYVYDADNRLQYEFDATSGLTEHRYDALGNRVQSVRYAEPQEGIQTIGGGSGLISYRLDRVTANVTRDRVPK